jgi:uncharacterized membrane protein YdjX (TVP38/TMEM64 family)
MSLTTAAAPPNRAWRKAAVIVAAVVVLYLLGRNAGQYVPRFAEWVESMGVWAPVIFILGYVVATVAFVPGSVLTLAAGAIFGVLEGTAVVFVAASLGACAAFLVSRYLARSLVEQRLASSDLFVAIDRAIGKQGRKLVVLLRLSPVFPFNLLNYALGLTDVRFTDYAIGCIGMLPGTLLYVYYGKVAGDVAAAAAGSAPERGPAGYALIAVGLVATIAVTAIITRTARRALEKEVGES